MCERTKPPRKVRFDRRVRLEFRIETSGDGEINVKSRTQMKLHEAKIKARQELAEVLEKHKVTVEQVRGHVARQPKYAKPMRRLPHHHGIGTAANFVREVARHMEQGPPRPPAAGPGLLVKRFKRGRAGRLSGLRKPVCARWNGWDPCRRRRRGKAL